MKIKAILVVVGVAVLSAASFGQGFRGGMMGGPGGGNPTMLLRRDDVKKDLNLTDDQKAKLQDLQDGMRQKFMDAFQNAGDDPEARQKAMAGIMKEVTEATNKILTADQQKRLKEIFIQLGGSAVAGNPDIQKDLGLTDEQKTKIADLSKRLQAANAELFRKMRDGEIQGEEVGTTMAKNTKVLNDEIDKVLTQDQKDKLKAMGGKSFTATDPPFKFGGGGGGF